MKLNEKQQWTVIGAFFLLGVLILGYTYYSDTASKETARAYFSNLMGSSQVAVVVDLRDVPNNDSKTRQNIMNCGIGISGSPALASKAKLIYGIEADGTCVISYPNDTHEMNVTIERCEREVGQFVSAVVKYGSPRTDFKNTSMTIYIDQNTNTSCRLTLG